MTQTLSTRQRGNSWRRVPIFGIAYRVLGSVVEAEDIVQDAWLRWQNTNRADIVEPTAFLATITSRLAINLAQSAPKRASRTSAVAAGAGRARADPQLGAERAEALDMAVLHLMEKLNPVERAAYVLREAFDYPYKRIADMLETSEANTRQLVSRALERLSAERREPVSPAAHRRLLEVFLSAVQTGNLSVLEDVLTADVVSYSDGGGMRGASRIPVVGRSRCLQVPRRLRPTFPAQTEVRWVEANGRPAVLVSADGNSVALLSVDVSERGIERNHCGS